MGRIRSRRLVAFAAAALAAASPAAGGEITFRDVAAGGGAGIDYRRAPSATNAAFERIKREPYYTMASIVATPEKPRGAPGVALLDHDGDGDLDIYVTNGPGAANSLFSNRLVETGRLHFVDVAEAAGVAATEQDSTGVCYGDLDNDGDPDLLVLGRSEPNRLFENRGPGPDRVRFEDVSEGSGLGDDDLGHTSCAVGDVDGDGLLDVAIANSYDWRQRAAILTEPWSLSHPNQLFLNRGGLRFRDVSESSGIRRLTGFRPPQEGAATITWAIALVDYDQDGDLDLFHADDQGALPPERVSRGLIQVLRNDGAGRFTAITHEAGTDLPGSSWMGLSFADFDCDGRMDFFATNMGDYAFSVLGFPFERGWLSSRWFLGRPDGGFADPGTGKLRATAFGWSVTAPDLDNDGDPDVAYFGSLDATIHTITADNPGTLLVNQGCSAAFTSDLEALAVDHARRNVQGGASGDLDLDGFPDLVTVSAFDIPESIPLKAYPVQHDSPFDPHARYVEVFAPAGAGTFVWQGHEFPDGSLAVEVNSGGNGNGWIEVRTLGAAGVVPGAGVNRDGIGAVVRVTPAGGRPTLRPVMGGSSYASQDSLALLFGLGKAGEAIVEVLWPGGVRNRLYGVAAGERLLFPEIPCDFRAGGPWAAGYRTCLDDVLDRLVAEGHLEPTEAERFLESALRARREERDGAPAWPAGERPEPARAEAPADPAAS